MTPSAHCEINPDCERRFDEHRAWLKDLQDQARRHGEYIAAIRAQVALAAGFGAIVGGALVSYLVKGH